MSARKSTDKLLWLPLLAATLPPTTDLDALPYPLWASPKIDGFRCMVQNGLAVSRKGIPYRNRAVQAWFASSNLEGVDGELTIGNPWEPDVFNRAQNVVNSGKAEAEKEFERHGQFWLFGFYGTGTDSPDNRPGEMFEQLRVWNSFPKVHIVKQKLIRDAAQLRDFEVNCLTRGYEGVMLRRADGPAYPQKPGKDNRSTLNEFWLVKLKRFDYDFAIIKAAHPLEHNGNEEKTAAGKRSSKRAGIVTDTARIGSVTLRHGKYEFSVNVQTKELRNKGPLWWASQLGKRVRYKHQSVGRKDAPRFPQATFEELL